MTKGRTAGTESKHIQELAKFIKTKPLAAFGMLLVTLLLAGGDLLDMIPSAQSIIDTTAFKHFHRAHDILAIGFVLLVAYFGTVALGATLLGVFFLVHIPYIVLEYPESGLGGNLPLFLIVILGVGFLGMAGQLDSALQAQQNIADTLQDALLTVPEKMDGIDFAHFYNSATEMTKVGGDFYDLFEREDNTVGITIGDVSGKGLQAATLTALIKNTIRAYAYEHDDPAFILNQTNKAIISHMPDSATCATAIFAVLDKKSGILTYTNAGHPPPIIKTKQSDTPVFGGGSLPIGVFADASYKNEKATLGRGDAVVFYTDGVIEARSNKGMFGEAGLIQVIQDSKAKNVQELTRGVFDAVNAFSQGRLLDDLALLVISLGKGR